MASVECPKCGNQWVRTTYLPKRDMLRKSCGCGYHWEEAPVTREADRLPRPATLREPAR